MNFSHGTPFQSSVAQYNPPTAYSHSVEAYAPFNSVSEPSSSSTIPNYGYPGAIFDAPHQPHDLAVYSHLQRNLREDQRRTGNLHSFAVQASHGNGMLGSSEYTQQVAYPDNLDPLLAGVGRPKGRFEEKVDQEKRRKLDSKPEQQRPSEQYDVSDYMPLLQNGNLP